MSATSETSSPDLAIALALLGACPERYISSDPDVDVDAHGLASDVTEIVETLWPMKHVDCTTGVVNRLPRDVADWVNSRAEVLLTQADVEEADLTQRLIVLADDGYRYNHTEDLVIVDGKEPRVTRSRWHNRDEYIVVDRRSRADAPIADPEPDRPGCDVEGCPRLAAIDGEGYYEGWCERHLIEYLRTRLAATEQDEGVSIPTGLMAADLKVGDRIRLLGTNKHIPSRISIGDVLPVRSVHSRFIIADDGTFPGFVCSNYDFLDLFEKVEDEEPPIFCCGGDSKACMVSGPCHIERERRSATPAARLEHEPDLCKNMTAEPS